MIRIKDPKKSLKFYQDIMGMKLLRTSENKDAGFNLYFLGYGPDAPEHTANGVNPVSDREGLLELTWNYGTEEQQGQVYHNGNDEPQGFGHIAVSVDNLDAACKRLEEAGVEWKKRLTDGRMKHVAFVFDPDHYWIEGKWHSDTCAGDEILIGRSHPERQPEEQGIRGRHLSFGEKEDFCFRYGGCNVQ